MNTFIDLSGYEITQDVFNDLPSKRKNAVSTIYGYIYTDKINDLYNLPVIENKTQWIFNYDNIIFILDLVEMDYNIGNNSNIIIRLTCSNNNCSKIAKFIQIKDINKHIEKIKKNTTFNKILKLNETQFKNLFLKTVKQLIKENDYEINGIEAPNANAYYLKCPGKIQRVNRIDLWRLKGSYSSVYEFWYKCYNYTDFFSKTKLPIYDYQKIQNLIQLKFFGKNTTDDTDMVTIVNWVMESFKENDTLWYEIEEHPIVEIEAESDDAELDDDNN
jgi:hypothetical protein